jgi:hypothetical protein
VAEGGCAGFGLRLCRYRGPTDLAERQSRRVSVLRGPAPRKRAQEKAGALTVAASWDPARKQRRAVAGDFVCSNKKTAN